MTRTTTMRKFAGSPYREKITPSPNTYAEIDEEGGPGAALIWLEDLGQHSERSPELMAHLTGPTGRLTPEAAHAAVRVARGYVPPHILILHAPEAETTTEASFALMGGLTFIKGLETTEQEFRAMALPFFEVVRSLFCGQSRGVPYLFAEVAKHMGHHLP